MKVLKGNYLKKDGSNRDVNLLILEKNDSSVSGIDIGLLSEEDRSEVKKITDEYWTKINKYMKECYRCFIKENFTESHYEEI